MKRVIRGVAAGILAAAVMLVPSGAAAQGNNPTPQQRGIILASPAVVFIETSVRLSVKGDFVEGGRRTSYKETFPYSTGSGFTVSPDGAVVTAAHVVQPSETEIMNYGANQAFALSFELSFPTVADAIRATFSEDPFARWNFPRCTPGLDSSSCIFPAEQLEYNACFQGRICEFKFEPKVEVFTATSIASETVSTGDPAEVVDATDFGSTDIALLETQTENQPTIPLADSVGDIQSGARVAVLGFGASTQDFPTGLTEPQKVFGQVSTIRPEGTSQILEVNVQAEGGFSGGPVLDNSGRVIGLLSFDIVTAEGESPQEFVRVVDDIHALIGDRASRGPVDENFQRGMQYFWGSHFTAAVRQFRNVLDLNPGHPLAQEFLADARPKVGTEADIPLPKPGVFLGLPIWLWVVIGVVVVALILLLVMMMSRRRRKAAPAAGVPGYAAPPAGFGAPPPAAQPSGPPVAQPPQAAPTRPPQAPAPQPQAAPTRVPPPAGVGAGQGADERRPVGFQAGPPAAGETTVSQQPEAPEEAPPPPGIGTSKFCSNCGMENASDATYCARCGHTLS